jgi:hypothetical protein
MSTLVWILFGGAAVIGLILLYTLFWISDDAAEDYEERKR